MTVENLIDIAFSDLGFPAPIYDEGVTAVKKQFLFSVKDLRFASLMCGRCNTRVTMDFDVTEDAEARTPRFFVPRECPRCSTRYDSVVPPAIEQIQRSYQALSQVADAVLFSADDDEESPTK